MQLAKINEYSYVGDNNIQCVATILHKIFLFNFVHQMVSGDPSICAL